MMHKRKKMNEEEEKMMKRRVREYRRVRKKSLR
jgi:hypothetical protein